MEPSKKNYIIGWGLIILAVIAFFGWRLVGQNQTAETQNPNQNQTATTTQTSSAELKTTLDKSNIQIIQPVAKKVSTLAPELDRPIPDTSKLDPGTVLKIEASMQITIGNLRKNSNSFNDWINLGLDRKTLGDYTGARDAWEYISLLYPQNSISFGNLGDLYANFLKDLPKAEARYQTAIKNVPTNIDMYRNLFNIYISENKNTEAMVVLQDGIAKNPDSLDLYILLARYYRDAGNITSAKIYYNQAISIANKDGNTSVTDALRAEESAM